MSEIELESFGKYSKNLTTVTWYECRANTLTRRAVVIPHGVKPSCYRKTTKSNKFRFKLEDGKVYKFERVVSVAPRKGQSRWFRMNAGKIEFLDPSVNPAQPFLELGFSILQKKLYDKDADDFLAANGRWSSI